MSKTIFDYTAATGIDASVDYLLIEQAVGPIYKKINRNTLLGITGSPLGTSDSQSVTNKTLDNTNTLTLKDTLFTLQDDGDTSKQAKFQLSGITSATTRTYTLPDASTTLVGTGATQTLTAKTLTSPVITGGTYDNGTITVDSISGHTSATIVTVGGVQMNNGTIGTAGAVTTTSIATNAITPVTLNSAAASSWVWQTWAPSYTNFTVGNGVLTEAKYVQVGKTVFCRYKFILGTTSAVSGAITISPPITPSSNYSATPFGYPIGYSNFDNTSNFFPGSVLVNTSGNLELWPQAAGNTYTQLIATSASIPFAWAQNHRIWFEAAYEGV